MNHPLRDAFAASLADRAAPIRGLRVLLWGFSGRGFPGGDGVAEAVEWLPRAGVHAIHSTEHDPERQAKLAEHYDVSIVCNTRVGAVLSYEPRVWECAKHRVWWFWDLRPGFVGAPLRGKPTHVFLSYRGEWTSPAGAVFSPAQWRDALGCPVGYAPQGAPLRDSLVGDGHRVVFVGDLKNPTYHQGRKEMCEALGATVINARERARRLEIEAQLPALYPSSRYCLSMSPLAPGYTSVRTYSILACGGLLLLHRFPGCDELFPDGSVPFDTAGEALARMRLLDDDGDCGRGIFARHSIASAGRLLHATRHTVAHRVVEICRQVTGVDSAWL